MNHQRHRRPSAIFEKLTKFTHQFCGRAKDYITNGPREYHADGLISIDLTDVMPAFDYHLEELTRLDAISRVEYTFTHITNDSRQSRMLVKRMLAGACPENLSFESVAPGDASPMTVVAWCEHVHTDAWERFLRGEDQAAEPAQ